MRNLLFGCCLAVVCPVVLGQAAPVADRVAQQNGLFEEYYQWGLKTSPEFHDEILNGGAMPLDLLEERVERWIKTQMPQEASAETR